MGLFSRKAPEGGPRPVTGVPVEQPQPAMPVKTVAKWNSQRFKLQLKMAKNRIELQRNKIDNNTKRQQRNVAQLLLQKKDGMARIRMEQVVRDGVQAEAMEIVELFTELLIARSTLCEVTPSLTDAPGDFREAVTSVCFAAHRLDVPELRTVANMFRAHFGEAVIDPITRCEGEYASSINTRLAQKLNMNVPEGRLILTQLQKVADEYRIEWKAPPEFEDLHNQSVLDADTAHSYQPIPPAYAHNIPGYNPGYSDQPPGPGPSAPPGGDFGPPGPPPPSYNGGGGGGGGGGSGGDGTYNIPGFAPGAPPGPGLYPPAGGGYDPPPPPPPGGPSGYDSFSSAPPSAPPPGEFGGAAPRGSPPPAGDDLSSDLMSRFNNLKKK